MSSLIHPTAIVEADVVLGDGTTVWNHVHVRSPATIGRRCIVGGGTYIAYGVSIGDFVKLNSYVYVCTGVTIERGVMVSAGTVFTNDRFPRATDPDLEDLRPSEPDEHTERTLVREGATIGASAVIGPGLVIGRFAMVGMGAVVTRDVPDHHLVAGSPARTSAAVCRCGPPIAHVDPSGRLPDGEVSCERCGRRYQLTGGSVEERDA